MTADPSPARSCFFTVFLEEEASKRHQWMSLEEAVAAQQDEPRKVMMDVYTQWCGPCKMMMRNTFTNADVISYINANYYAVKFDAEPDPVAYQDRTFENPGWNPNARGRNSTHQLSRALGVKPTQRSSI